MAQTVKRSYHSARRQSQALATRAVIREAAHDLFLTDGYAATTVKAIADAAGTAPQTVYSQFGTKAAIVRELLDVRIVGDDAAVAVAEREWFSRVFDRGLNASERLRRYAASCRRIYAGAGSTFEIIRRGADGDAELAELWATNVQQRRSVVARVLDAALRDRRARLADRLDRARALDVLFLLHGPETFHLLVEESGWDLDAYETWLGDAFCTLLLGPPRPVRPQG